MTNPKTKLIALMGSVAIAGIIAVQAFWLNQAWDASARQFNQSVHVALKNVADRMANYNRSPLPTENPVNQLSSDYFVVNVNDAIDANILEYYLKAQLELMNINTDFEYGIYDCNNDKMVYGSYVDIKGDAKTQRNRSHLPKYNQFVYYFGVRFPNREAYLGSDMEVWVILSAILVLAIVFFAYAMFVIHEQNRLSQLQKDFINNMTHEFKTPIATIRISADVLANPSILKSPDRLARYAQIIKQENERLHDQVEKVLNVSRIERNGFNLNKERIHLHELIETLKSSFETQGMGSRGKIELNLESERDLIWADKLHLTNVLFNLLDNALKYGKENPEVQISTRDEQDCMVLSVADNGIGISREHLKRVFKKFFRVPTGNRHDVKGFGLGLYYVNNVCKAHKWKLKVESELGEGTTFTIRIQN